MPKKKNKVGTEGKKAHIPKALREQVWVHYNKRVFTAKCYVEWCTNNVTPFDFEVGHNIPESKGGTLDIDNLRPICGKCNRSMGNSYTIDEFSDISKPASVAGEEGCGCSGFFGKKIFRR